MTPPSLSAEAVEHPALTLALNTATREQLIEGIRALRSQAESLKETNTRLNRRCQEAERALPDYKRMLAVPPDGDGVRFVSGNLGRALLATQCARLAEQVEALERYAARYPQLAQALYRFRDSGTYRDAADAHGDRKMSATAFRELLRTFCQLERERGIDCSLTTYDAAIAREGQS